MEKQLLAHIPLFRNATTIKRLHKGFSTDQKFIIDNQYLVRAFSSEQSSNRQAEFHTLAKLSALSKVIPKAIEYNVIKELNLSYMVLTYIPGEDGEKTLKELDVANQYEVGYAAGVELKKIHAFSAPKDMETWYDVKKRKSDAYIEDLTAIDIDEKVKNTLVQYIKRQEYLMKGRPNCFQHDDFHPGNILIDNGEFSGIIDFQQMDWGDPIHDLQKLGFFSTAISVPFTKGVVDGYHQNREMDEEFWNLYTLYSAMHIVSALVWGKKMGTFEQMLSYSMHVIEDHDCFARIVPKWYEGGGM